MARKKKTPFDDLYSLPYVHPRHGKPYLRIVYYVNGKQRSVSRRVSTVAEAICVTEEIKRKLGLHGPDAFDGERMTFAELMAAFRVANKKIPKWYAEPPIEFFGARRIASITHADLRRFKAAREETPNRATGETRRASTLNRELEWLRAVFLYAVRHGWLAVNPFGRGDQPLISKAEEESRTRIPTPDEEARILSHCTGIREHLHGVLIAARDTGLRKSALLALTWSCVDFENGFLRIPTGNRYKKRPKMIGMTARLKAELSELWEKSEKNIAAKIFGGIKDVKRSYNTACRLAGVTDLHFHDWRHGYATDMMEAGVEERLAMRATGHTSAEMHAKYTNIDERIARAIADQLDVLHKGRGQGVADVTDEIQNEFVN